MRSSIRFLSDLGESGYSIPSAFPSYLFSSAPYFGFYSVASPSFFYYSGGFSFPYSIFLVDFFAPLFLGSGIIAFPYASTSNIFALIYIP